jgi:hypothetical protein
MIKVRVKVKCNKYLRMEGVRPHLPSGHGRAHT